MNRALHVAGMPLYILGIALLAGLLGGNSDMGPGALLLLAGVVMFTVGHKIEGNLGSITPVLAYRLISRNVRRYLAANRIHIQVPWIRSFTKHRMNGACPVSPSSGDNVNMHMWYFLARLLSIVYGYYR